MSEYAPAALDDLSVVTWLGEDGVPVVQIDTPSEGRFRVNVNDGPIWDQSSEEDSPAAKLAKAEADKRDLVEEGLRVKNRANGWSVKARGLEEEKDRLTTAVAAVESVRDGLRRRAASDHLLNPACADVYREAADAIDAALASPAPFVLPTKTPARLAAKDKAWGKPATFTLITDGRSYRAWRDEHNQLWPEDVILTAFTDHRVIEETPKEADRG